MNPQGIFLARQYLMNNVTPLQKQERTIRLEIKSTDDATGEFEGYGSVFGNVDSYNEVVAKGAFTNSLNEKSPKGIKLLWQHDSSQPIGVWENMYEDDKGLYVKGRLLINDVAKAKEAYALLKVGALDGLSIGFTVNPGGIQWSNDGSYKLLTDVNLWEVSVVTFPANARAVVNSIKDMDMQKRENSIRDFENFLRESGNFSNREAVEIASFAKELVRHPYIKGLQREAEGGSNESLSDEVLEIMTALKQGVKDLI